MSDAQRGLKWEQHSTVTSGVAIATISMAENDDGARMYSVSFQRKVAGRDVATRYFRLGDLDALIDAAMEVRKQFEEGAAKAEQQRVENRRAR